MEEKTLDPGVATILNGLELGKYVALFEEHNVSRDLFLSLNEDDLKTIGIDDQRDIDLLLKCIRKCKKFKYPEPRPLEFDEITQILNNTENYLHSVNVASSYVHKQMQKNKPIDSIVYEDTAASSAIAILSDRIQVENNAMIEDIDRLIEKLGGKREKATSLKKVVLSCTIATAITSILIAALSIYRKFS